MGDREEVIRLVQKALEHEPRINLHRYPIKIGYADSAVILEGEVGGPAAKKLALEQAASVGHIRGSNPGDLSQRRRHAHGLRPYRGGAVPG